MLQAHSGKFFKSWASAWGRRDSPAQLTRLGFSCGRDAFGFSDQYWVILNPSQLVKIQLQHLSTMPIIRGAETLVKPE